jgi:hypothetical protein
MLQRHNLPPDFPTTHRHKSSCDTSRQMQKKKKKRSPANINNTNECSATRSQRNSHHHNLGIMLLTLNQELLHSDPTPTFSHTSPSIYTPIYETPNPWDCITVISDFPDTVPAHPFDILPCLAPKPFNLASLLCSWPYSSHCFIEFHPYRTDGDPTKLWLMA